jgi:dTDP-4-dehydrorhamnose 3,5-epimerase
MSDSGRFLIHKTPLPGLMEIQRKRIGDARGFLERLFCADELAEAGWKGPVVQINRTLTTRKGTVRGMHFQHPPHAETKLVMCLRGRVFDVAVDIRQGSPTFLKWHGAVLHPENGAGMLIPAGFAHGFQTLSDDVEMLYCHSAAFAPNAEGGLNPRDRRVGVAWPMEITELSDRDKAHPHLDNTFKGVRV